MSSSVNTRAILYPYQRRWIDDQSRLKIGVMARQVGKTFTTTLEIAEDLVRAELSGQRTRWVILSRGERQAKEAMDEGVKLHLKAFDVAFDSLESDYRLTDNTSVKQLEITTRGGSRITALPANPDTARGFSANVFLDEFAFHQDSYKIWAALYPVISKPELKLRITSTPNGRGNKFADLVHGDDLSWSRHSTDIYQAVADGLPRNVESLRAGFSDDLAWRQEFELDFDVAAYNQFIGADIVLAASTRVCGGLDSEPLLLGVDVARFGDDTSTLTFRRGFDAKSLPAQTYKGLDTLALAGRVVAAANEHRVDTIFVDGVGVGGGVVDQLRGLGLDSVIDVNASAKSDVPECYNKRSEMYYHLRNWLDKGAIANDGHLHKELTIMQYRYTDDRKLRLEPKDEIKKRLGRSPDRADGLALTFAYPVANVSLRRAAQSKPYDPLRVRYDYNPLKA